MKAAFACLFILLFIFPGSGFAQEKGSPTSYGVELDVVPFLLGGLSGQVWYGKNRLRIRAGIAHFKLPDFVLAKGYQNARMDAHFVIADYFFKNDFKGYWVGAGVENWRISIEHEKETQKAEFNNTVLTIGGGYVWPFYGNLYLNPWAAGHFIVGGDKEVAVGSRMYKPDSFNYSVSIKLGWQF